MRSSSAPRIEHDAAVTLESGEKPIEARAVNLSVGGIFVRADEQLDPGEPVGLKIELGDGGLPIEARAEVVWVRDHGMALRFVRLDDTSERRIQRLVAQKSREPTGMHPRDVRIHLASLPAPLRAVARDQTAEGIMLEAELPWLKLGSEVTTELSADRACTGLVRWVGLDVTRSGSARLRIYVDIQESSGVPDLGVSGPPIINVAKAEPYTAPRPKVGSGRVSAWLAGAATLAAAGFAALWLMRPPPVPNLLPSQLAPEQRAEGHAPPVLAIPKAALEAAATLPLPTKARHHRSRK